MSLDAVLAVPWLSAATTMHLAFAVLVNHFYQGSRAFTPLAAGPLAIGALPWLFPTTGGVLASVVTELVWVGVCSRLAPAPPPPAAPVRPASARPAVTTGRPAARATDTAKPKGFVQTPILSVIAESAEIKTFRLARPDGFDFTPGQFLTVRLRNDGKDVVRCYSLSSAPAARGYLEISVRKQGRVSNAQQRYYDEMMEQIGVPYVAAPHDLGTVFGRSSAAAPKILEIGFGMGETSAAIAAANPQNDYLGIEVHTPGVGSLLKLIAESELANVRVVQHDAVEVVRDMLAPGVLAGIHLFFPDPWPKKRHHKRRLIKPDFVALLASRLAPGGYFHCATDWEEYAGQMLEVLGGEPTLANTAEGFAPRPDYRPLTKFEQRGLRLGHGVWDVVFRKKETG